MPETFRTKIVGVTQPGRQQLINTKLSEGESLLLVRERNNSADRNAVMVLTENKEMIGYLSRERASEVAPKMDAGWHGMAFVDMITGLEMDIQGVNIEVYLYPPNEIKRLDDSRPVKANHSGKIALISFFIVLVAFVLIGTLGDSIPEVIGTAITLIFLVSTGVFIWSIRKWFKSRSIKK